MWHTDRPIPQQRLASSLANLALALSPELFFPFISAFWTTIAREWLQIDALRLDKYLLLARRYVNSGFVYLSQRAWDSVLCARYLEVIGRLPLSASGAKVSDGLRYHVLDIWLDELDVVDGQGEESSCPVEELMTVVHRLKGEAKTKPLRERAGECLADERLKNWKQRAGEENEAEIDQSDSEWGGLTD